MPETTLFTDNFNRADTASGLGPDWEVTRGVGGQILGNRVAHGPSNGQGDRIDPTLHPFPVDQWAEYTVVGGGFTWAGIGVRVQANASGEQKGYFFWYNGAQRIIAWHRVGGAGEQTLASIPDSSQFSAGDVIRLSAVDEYTGETFDGVRLRAYINGVEVMTALDTHAGAWRSGQPGWNCWGGGTGRGFDDYSAGSFTTGSPEIVLKSSRHVLQSDALSNTQKQLLMGKSSIHNIQSNIVDFDQDQILNLKNSALYLNESLYSPITDTKDDGIENFIGHIWNPEPPTGLLVVSISPDGTDVVVSALRFVVNAQSLGSKKCYVVVAFQSTNVPVANIKINGILEADCAEFTGASTPLSRNFTTAEAVHNIASGSPNGTWIYLEITNIINEIMAQPGWTSGNNIGLVILPGPNASTGDEIKFRDFTFLFGISKAYIIIDQASDADFTVAQKNVLSSKSTIHNLQSNVAQNIQKQVSNLISTKHDIESNTFLTGQASIAQLKNSTLNLQSSVADLIQKHIFNAVDSLCKIESSIQNYTQGLVLAVKSSKHDIGSNVVSFDSRIELVLKSSIIYPESDQQVLTQKQIADLKNSAHNLASTIINIGFKVDVVLTNSMTVWGSNNVTFSQAQLVAFDDVVHNLISDRLGTTTAYNYVIIFSDSMHEWYSTRLRAIDGAWYAQRIVFVQKGDRVVAIAKKDNLVKVIN